MKYDSEFLRLVKEIKQREGTISMIVKFSQSGPLTYTTVPVTKIIETFEERIQYLESIIAQGYVL